ncbi:MAG: hypothetical protein K9G58_02650 [Bacteroidales bacterium]|nr:hypothetical protein [Bacteroidales bacterium]MCF8397038.1 hypothetical protein [Bacteroidales bacterium]
MDLSSYINLNSLSEEARKELKIFYDFLVFKYQKPNRKHNTEEEKIKSFVNFAENHQIELPKDYKFNREEANRR